MWPLTLDVFRFQLGVATCSSLISSLCTSLSWYWWEGIPAGYTQVGSQSADNADKQIIVYLELSVFLAYCTFYIVGTLMSMQIPFVGFQPIRTSEHMAAAGKTEHLSMPLPPLSSEMSFYTLSYLQVYSLYWTPTQRWTTCELSSPSRSSSHYSSLPCRSAPARYSWW